MECAELLVYKKNYTFASTQFNFKWRNNMTPPKRRIKQQSVLNNRTLEVSMMRTKPGIKQQQKNGESMNKCWGFGRGAHRVMNKSQTRMAFTASRV